jgi:hypothetical protein
MQGLFWKKATTKKTGSDSELHSTDADRATIQIDKKLTKKCMKKKKISL